MQSIRNEVRYLMKLWEVLKANHPEQLEKLKEYQRKTHGAKLDFEIESPAELEVIMRQPPQKPKRIK